jgi:ribosomal protein S18 acetylase RimI-like enzyme
MARHLWKGGIKRRAVRSSGALKYRISIIILLPVDLEIPPSGRLQVPPHQERQTMKSYPLEKKLRDGKIITIREAHPGDEEKMLAFFKLLPKRDRQYLRMDVTKLEHIRNRMNPGPFMKIWRIVAAEEEQIRADATLCGYNTGWMRHVSEIRCIVHPEHQKRGIGAALMWELFQKTLNEKYDIVFSEVVPEQQAAIKVLENLGFTRAMVRPNHVRDLDGVHHDLYVYLLNVKMMWARLKNYFLKFDTGPGQF